jgi:hypothetical protein
MAGLSRDAFLQHVGKLAEELVDVKGMGKVLCRELTGSQRALVLGVLAPAAQEGGGKVDFGLYQEMLLRLGLIDPADGQPLLDLATAKQAMELGASKVEALCSAIERLSGLSGKAPESAEKNSVPTPSSSATSE